MPAQKSTTGLAKMLGAKGVQAVVATKGKAINWGFQNLPPDINGGIAQVMQCYWDTHEKEDSELKGKPRLNFRCVVKSPKMFKEQKTEGVQFTLQIPLCDTPNRKRITGQPGTFQDYVNDAMDEFKKLLGEDAVDQVVTSSPNDAIDILVQLIDQAKPHTKFSTRGHTPKPTAQKPNPTEAVYPKLGGVTTYDSNGDATQGMVDNSPPAKPSNGTSKPGSKPTAKPAPEPEPEPESPPFDEFQDLVSKASGDEDTKERDEAQATLRQRAEAMGYDDQEINDAPDWEAVANMGSTPKHDADAQESAESPPDEEPTPEGPTWEVGHMCKYQRIDAKTGKSTIDVKTKKPTRPLECEVVKVNANGTVDIKDVATKTVFKNISTDAITE